MLLCPSLLSLRGPGPGERDGSVQIPQVRLSLIYLLEPPTISLSCVALFLGLGMAQRVWVLI